MQFCEDDFDIGVQIGKGRFGEVFQAKLRSECQQNVAIKIIKKEGLHDYILKMFDNEMTFHQKFNHSNIIKFVASFKSDVAYYIVMELAKENLFSFLQEKNKAFPERNAIGVLRQILSAVKYLQTKHFIIHRDIKLSNILITEIRGENRNESFDLTVKLCDFGLATKVAHPDELHYSICGTPAYLSPEVVNNDGYGYETDIWGIGKIFEALLTGKAPSTYIMTDVTKNSDYSRGMKRFEKRLGKERKEGCENVISTIHNIPNLSLTTRDFLEKALNPVSFFYIAALFSLLIFTIVSFFVRIHYYDLRLRNFCDIQYLNRIKREKINIIIIIIAIIVKSVP
jgi:serine/threonine protein kinase